MGVAGTDPRAHDPFPLSPACKAAVPLPRFFDTRLPGGIIHLLSITLPEQEARSSASRPLINNVSNADMGNRETGIEPETIIAAGVKVEGDFVSQGDVLIEGMVEGSLKTERDLRVGQKASINANVSASNATIAGEIKGNIEIGEKLELEPTAKLYGDVKTKVLVIASGALVNGSIAMGDKAPNVKQVRTEDKKEDKPGAKEDVTENEETREKRTVNAFFSAKG